jgi:hypothetical protein
MDFEKFDDVEVSDQEIKDISTMVGILLDKQAELAALTEQVKIAAKAIRDIEEKELPDLMDAAGAKDFTTSDGVKVSVESVVSASITKARESEAFKWLRDNGHAPLIKRELKVVFGKGQDNMAGEIKGLLTDKLAEMDIDAAPSDKSSVHAGTLKSWVKEMVNEGKEFPHETFGVWLGRKAKVKGAK